MKKILYVEDDPINALIMQKLLQSRYEVVHVPDGETCMARLVTENFDLILMDINLGRGKMDGVETLQRIRASPDTKDLIVITVTSYALPEDEERFLKEGFNDYLAKPVNRHVLQEMVSRYLGDG